MECASSAAMGKKSHIQMFYMFFLNLLLAQMPSTEKIKEESPDEPDSDSEDELTEEENQSDASSTEMQEESQSSGTVRRLRPKPAYLSSNSKSQKQSFLAVTSNIWSQRQRIRYSNAEKSIFHNILMVSSGTRLPPLQIYCFCASALILFILPDSEASWARQSSKISFCLVNN